MALRAICLGDNCIDRYLPPIDQEFVGGQAVNVARGLRRHGLAVAYAGVVGRDPAGERIVAELAGLGVDVTAVRQSQGPTGVTTIASTPDGERRFVSEEYGISTPYVADEIAFRLAAGSALVYGAHLADAAEVGRRLPRSVKYGLDASEADPDAVVLSRLDILFLSRSGLAAAEARSLGRSFRKRGVGTVVITLGPAGALAIGNGDETVFQQSAADTIVDTLGAGDALAAGFIAGLLKGLDLSAALQLGRDGAAAACGHLGP